ncbi:MAG: hypothetical protein FWD85_02570 [Microbacteriaceae bacterium]|nr:hypothetical protein [Microbacteriaceae bacterium]MCL2794175.1 hypothetical protein [Microbacteriaceae bacterium]
MAKVKTKDLVKLDEEGRAKSRLLPNTFEKSIDRLMNVQRPVVLAHLEGIRRRHPNATAEQLHFVLEQRYLTAVTTTGAATGATAVIPAIGTITALALSAAETVAFLETTALFAQSVAELHGVTVDDPDRARGLVLSLMLGKEGSEIIQQFGLEMVSEDVSRAGYWGTMVTESLPNAFMKPLLGKLKTTFMKKVASHQFGSVIGRALPYGLGAAVGGIGNNLLGRRVTRAARGAFPPADVIVLEDVRAERALQREL